MLGITQSVLKNKIKNEKLSPSGYKPEGELLDLYTAISQDLDIGRRWLTRAWQEFNGRTLVDEMNETARAFNTYIPERREDPLHSWRAQTRRPILRNKLINTIAHATKSTLIPGIYAYDPMSSEQDELGATAMRSMINWVIQNSDYAEEFVNFVTDIVSQPAGIMEIGYQTVMRTIREADGTTKEVIDEDLSGHFFMPLKCNELLIDNPYEPNIQRQRWVAVRKLISYDEAKSIYQNEKNFQYVRPGVHMMVHADSNLFYEINDGELEGRLVEEVRYYNRSQDLEVIMLGGVMLGDPFRGNRYAHKKYPFAKVLYEPINSRFFWGKSQANKLLPDEKTINTLRNMFIDGTFLQMMPPWAVFGDEQPHQLAMVPGAMNAFDEEVKMQSMAPANNTQNGLVAMQEIEKSMIETSTDEYRAGSPTNLPDRMPAYSMAKLEENAQIQLGLLLNALAFGVTHISTLLISNIIQFNTVPQLTAGIDNELLLQYPSFVVENEDEDGQDVSKRLVFNPNFFATDKAPMDASMEILKMEGLNTDNKRIMMLNPEPFRKLKYKAFAGSDTLQRRNTIIDKALKLESYDRMIANPLIQQDPNAARAVTRDFLIGAVAPGKAAKYMPGEQSAPQPTIPTETPAQGSGVVGQISGSNSLQNMMALQNEDVGL